VPAFLAVRLNADTYPVDPQECVELEQADAELLALEGETEQDIIQAACHCDALLVISAKVPASLIEAHGPGDMQILRMTRDIGMESAAGRKTSEIMVALILQISRAIEMANMVTRAATATWRRTSESTAKGSCVDIRMATVGGSRV